MLRLVDKGLLLVPIGDRLLFANYDFCLNLGGFANVSYEKESSRIAFDVCPANMVLNTLSQKKGRVFDCDGELATAGHLDVSLLDKLDALPFYAQTPPKSLGKEWVLENIYPLLEQSECSVEDKLNTFCVHIARQVGIAVPGCNGKSLLVSGGGACNTYLISMIRAYTRANVVVPDTLTIHFKEALIFAFLGVLRIRNEVNTLASVTGARTDHSGGSVWNGNSGL